jgi:small subunit ribosomal protein S6
MPAGRLRAGRAGRAGPTAAITVTGATSIVASSAAALTAVAARAITPVRAAVEVCAAARPDRPIRASSRRTTSPAATSARLRASVGIRWPSIRSGLLSPDAGVRLARAARGQPRLGRREPGPGDHGDDEDDHATRPGDVPPAKTAHEIPAHGSGRRSARAVRPALATMRRRMASEAPVYDLVLLLDNTIEQERRDTILANVEDAIDRAGEIVGRHDWGVRPTVYEVRKQSEADYHLIQFRGSTALLEQLDHNLKITDGILRFRIIRLRPGTPDPPDLRPAALAAAPAAPAETE